MKPNRRTFWQGGAWTLALALGANVVGSSQAAKAGRDDNTIFLDTFDVDVNGWMAVGPHAHIGITNESGKVKNGKNALVFNYRLDATPPGAGEPPIDALLRPTPVGLLAKARSLSFWARSDGNAPLALSLSEKDGGHYLAMFWLPKNQWQHVVLSTEDFSLQDGKDDPKDPDGKLDMDQIESITVLNLLSFVSLSLKTTPGNAALFPIQNGEHALWLDDFTVGRDPAAPDAPEPALPVEKSGLWLDAFRRSTLAWLPLGTVEMQLDKSAPTKGRALRLDYTQEAGKITAAIHDVHSVDLTRYDHLEFDIASSKAGKILLTLEEKGGARYNTIIDVPGDSMPAHKVVYFANFMLADDSPKDADGKLDLDQLKTFGVVDISAFITPQKQQNTLWIGPIRASQAK